MTAARLPLPDKEATHKESDDHGGAYGRRAYCARD